MEIFTHPDGETHLTRRERECLILVANGYSAKQIAYALKINQRTVERHLDQARMKFNARNRAHMVLLGVQAGLIDFD